MSPQVRADGSPRQAKTTASGLCPTCRKRVGIKADGSLRSHGYLVTPGYLKKCEGVGMPPVEGSEIAR